MTYRSEDIWYALANTEVIVAPQNRLQTFGSTVITYHLLAEKMDSVNEVRVREGKVHAERPQVLTPAYFERLMLEGFGEEADQYASWLKDHIKDLTFIKYGFRFRKEEVQESTVHESLTVASDRVRRYVEEQGDPLTAIIHGVDEGWEVCLLKFMTDVIRNSAPQNYMDLQKRKLLGNVDGVPLAVREEIDRDFQDVGTSRVKMKDLGAKLQSYGIFESYEDRFYELVRRLS
jgi:hypothetical protein